MKTPEHIALAYNLPKNAPTEVAVAAQSTEAVGAAQWAVEAARAVQAAEGQTVCKVNGQKLKRTKDAARRIAANIAKLPDLLRKQSGR